jgi:hypothetical protein
MRLILFAIYIGIGAMLHALFLGPQFDWTSAWTFGWIFGWPLMALGALWTFCLAAMAVGGACYVGWQWLKMIAEWRERRRSARRRA